jgi:ribosomal protein L31E
MTQKFEEASSVLYDIKGVVGQKRKVKADKTVRFVQQRVQRRTRKYISLVFSSSAAARLWHEATYKILRHDLKNYPYKINILQTLSAHKKIIQ